MFETNLHGRMTISDVAEQNWQSQLMRERDIEDRENKDKDKDKEEVIINQWSLNK